jgi:hypothetical protein
MQADGAVRGNTTIPRPRRLRALLAIVVIAALVALLVWAALFATSGGGAEDSNPSAGTGSAIVHDDVGNTNRYSYPLPAGKVAGAGSAVLHDDAGDVHPH